MKKRGEEKTVPRYVVDRMARLKPVGYSHKEVVNSQGIKDVVYTPHVGLKYDFSVVRDPSPHGDSWLRSALAERS